MCASADRLSARQCSGSPCLQRGLLVCDCHTGHGAPRRVGCLAADCAIGTDLQRMHTFVSAQRNGTFRSTMPVLELSSPRLQLLAQDCAAIWWAKALQTPMRSRARKAGSKVRSTPNQRRAHTAGLKARSPLMHAAIRGSTSVLPPAASSSISTASTTTSPNYLGGVGLTVSST